MVLTDDPVNWWFDVGEGTQAWHGEHPPDPHSLVRAHLTLIRPTGVEVARGCDLR